MATRGRRAAGDGAGEPSHGAIQSELARLLGNHFIARSSPCSVVITPGVIPRLQSRTNFRIPDLAVSCADYVAEEHALTDPVLVVEILSPSNAAETWNNVWTYATIPSVREILILRSATIGVELLRRDADGAWPERPLTVETGDLVLESVSFSVRLIGIYRTTRLRPAG